LRGHDKPSIPSPRQAPVTISDVQELVRRKDEIEAQIKAYYDVLEDQKGVGMNEPLVDIEGYPRADVDVYQVRTARHNIICLQNDHKALMKQVEEALHQLHARGKEKQAKDAAEAQNEAMNQGQGSSWGPSPSFSQPFAKVNSISPGSPASNSGLQVDDEIVEFGSVNTHNFQNLQNIGTVVQHSEGVSWGMDGPEFCPQPCLLALTQGGGCEVGNTTHRTRFQKTFLV
uniref:26S proteasome non-ATPase regulatory subunit 9 n=1 Tax=Monodelphis domestica TaxID=13616 RepID=K7E186_MONDO